MLRLLLLLHCYSFKLPTLLLLNHCSLNAFFYSESSLIVDHCFLIWKSPYQLAFCMFCLGLKYWPLKDSYFLFHCSLGALVFLTQWLCTVFAMTLQFAPPCCFVILFWGALLSSWMHMLKLSSLQYVLIGNISLIILLQFLIS